MAANFVDNMYSRHRIKRMFTPGRLIICIVLVVMVFFLFFKDRNSTMADPLEKRIAQYFQTIKENETDDIDTRVADALKPKVRILCLVLTTEDALEGRVNAVRNTWAKRCDKHFFVLNTKRRGPDIINTNITESRYNIVYKTRQVLQYIHTHHMNTFDWLLKADDDTYLIMENLRYLLSNYDHDDPGYLGYHYNKFINNGFMSGGAGYVISNIAVRMLVEKGLNKHLCDVTPRKYNPENGEDLEIGHCLQKVGVNIYSSIDYKSRETFHPNNIETHLFGELPVYVNDMAKNPPKTGTECCSRFTISYHYVTPEMMIVIDHLLYRTSVYGHSIIPDKNRKSKIFNAKMVKKPTH